VEVVEPFFPFKKEEKEQEESVKKRKTPRKLHHLHPAVREVPSGKKRRTAQVASGGDGEAARDGRGKSRPATTAAREATGGWGESRGGLR
jgi:hypothetical protein